jgi:chromosome segregation ATPase
MSDSRVMKGLFSADLDEANGEALTPDRPGLGVWKRLQVAFSDSRANREATADEEADAEGRELLAMRLKEVQELGARTEMELGRQGAKPEAPPMTDIGSTPGTTSSDPTVEPSQALLSELTAAREQLKLAVEAHAAERATWEAAGTELKGRQNESVTDARMRAELQTELNGARAQLRQAIDGHNAELRACLDELKAAAAERASLEAALNTAQANHRQTADTHTFDRAAWETTRDELKAALQHSKAELRQTMDTHAGERTTWADTLQQVNAAVDSARADFTNASAAHHAELDARGKELREVRATLNATQQELDAKGGQFAAMAKTRADLETALEALQTRYQQIQIALDAANAKLHETTDAHASEQAAWEVARHELESRAQEFQAAAEAQGKTEQALQAATGSLRQTTEAYASDRSAWDVVRRELEADVNRVCADLEKAADAQHDELKKHKLELQNVADARKMLEAELTKAQAERQQALDARMSLEAAVAKADAERQRVIDMHASDRATWDATRHQLEEDVNSARAAITAFSEQASGLLRHLPAFGERAANPPAPVDGDANDATGPLSEEPPARGRLVGLRSASGRTRSDRESA